MPYTGVQKHMCSNPNCNKKYSWDCHIPDPIKSESYSVVELLDCVHGEVMGNPSYKQFPIIIKIQIECPYCGTKDEVFYEIEKLSNFYQK